MRSRPRSSQRRKPTALPSGRLIEVDVNALGARGDGLAFHDGEPVFVPFTLPGEHVLARIDGKRGEGLTAHPVEIVTPSAARIDPACRHFTRCGGCAMQHLDAASYGGWKRGLLIDAMARVGVAETQIAPLLMIAPGTRRRANFTYHRRRGALTLGFNARSSHEVIALKECPLLAPPLFALLPLLQKQLAGMIAEGASGEIIVTLTGSGIDVLIEGEARLDLFDRQNLASFADQADLARLSWRRPGAGMIEPLLTRRPPQIILGDVAVESPPGGFLQPSLEGERLLTELVLAGIDGETMIADLFAGCGSFTFPLARQAAIHAVEGDESAYRALKGAADRAGIRVAAEHRDLARRPLVGAELKRFQAIVFDPPRAGAAAQAEALAEAGPAKVIAVSCNPATLARDTGSLMTGGYRLTKVTPVDQFPWSPHLEAVAIFER